MINNLDNIIELNNISKLFPGVKALDDVTLHIKKGQIHALVGKNGAGKSTLVKILGGIYHKDSGNIIIEGKEIDALSPHDLGLLGIHFVYQEETLVPFLTVAENIFLGTEPSSSILPGFTSKRKMESEAKNIFMKLNFTSINIYKPVMLLSAAERQIVTIARILVSKKMKVIVLDEPTASLSYDQVNKLFDFILNLRKSGVSIIYISHRLEEIFQIADYVTILRDGKKIGTYMLKELNKKQLAEKITGHAPLISEEKSNIRELPEINSKNKLPVLKVCNLQYKNRVKNVSFEIYSGEVVALIGLVGSGKTELAETLIGYRKKESGDIFINNKKLKIKSPYDALKKGIVIIPEDRIKKSLMMGRTVRENLTISFLKNISRIGFLNKVLEKKLVRKIIDELLIKCASPEQNIDYLSGGNQQKVVVGRRIQNMPKVFIFDDISAGIDIETKEYFCRIIRKFANIDNIPSIYITGDTTEALMVSDRVLIMCNGVISKEFLTKELTEDTLLHNILVADNTHIE